MREQLKRSARGFLSITALLLLLSITTPTGDLTQDVNFRLLNIERRVDQMQQRVDYIERTLQNQSFSNRTTTTDPSISTTAILELQRKQLSQAEQILLLEKRMLEIQKTIAGMREGNPEVKETPKSDPKPKPKQ
jgi:hypothetical protein